ncbi:MULTISPECIES: hypothetical protein [Kytococcus]|uniref:Uncharacterized protein n=1 Tax=Kytococcus schroeteri TaxID=138300 RepID=A0A2I1PBS1_9MICO|nr:MULTISPECIES: hypothetical protein [Kytococcus]OFS14002.1 hypothetical protein HMPREF3099_05040 [Kytococcus sp. HMSC28H12]PKZ42076.1 hypothetical protein CYJ76_04310 [Kytococcus schroeteri]
MTEQTPDATERATTAELLQDVVHVLGDPSLSHEQVLALGDRLGQPAVLFLTAMAAHAAQIRVARELVDRGESLTDEQRGWLPDPVALGRALGTTPDQLVVGGAIQDTFGELTRRMLDSTDEQERERAGHQAESLALLGAALGGRAGQERLAELGRELGFGVAFGRLHAYFAMMVRQLARLTGQAWEPAVEQVSAQLRADAR